MNRQNGIGKKWIKRASVLAVAGALALTGLAGCGNGSETLSDGDVQKIIVGVVSSSERWGILDENGELDGYEIAVLKAIDEKLPQYKFELQGSDFSNILISLDTGKIDLGDNMFEYNDERAEKYLYGEEGVADFSTCFIVPIDSDYTTWESLAGKVIGAISQGGSCETVIEHYNEDNPDKALILGEYTADMSEEVKVKALLEGRWDAIYGVTWAADDYNEKYGNGKDIVKSGEVIGTSDSYYLYPKDGKHEELQQAVDGALRELKKDGTLKELSEKYFGFDITPKDY